MSRFNQLSEREWEVIEQLLQGKSNKSIASALDVTESTVEFHLKNIYTKIQVRSRIELILALWKTTGKATIEELGYSPVDSQEKGIENGGKQPVLQYGRIQKTMRMYKLVLIICVIGILFPLVSLSVHAITRPESNIIWGSIIAWILPVVALLILLLLLPRKTFQPLLRLAGLFLLVLLVIGLATIHFFGYFFSAFGLFIWLFPYLLGAGGILVAAWSRSGNQIRVIITQRR